MASVPGSAPRPFAWMASLFFGPESREAKPVPRAREGAPPRRSPAHVPELTMLEWDGGRSANDALHESPLSLHDLDPRRRGMRDRYIAARFFGLAACAADLERVDATIKGARLLFDDGRPGLALELLELAIQEAPHEAAFWLARLEILFLVRRAEAFTVAAREFRAAHRGHEAWPEVERLGRVLAPAEAIFGGTPGGRSARDHYGPWPDLPNWIRAPWDLTAEVMAADFRRLVLGLGAERLSG